MAKKARGAGARPGGGGGIADGKRIRVTLVRSPIGFNRTQGETVTGLGLRRLRHTVEVLDTPETRGMIHKVRHLVTVHEEG